MRTSPADRKACTRIVPLLIAALFYIGALSLTWIGILHIDKGVQPYSLDDPYIHLAIAKNLVQHHVYGVTPNEFSPASSSVVWPFLLAGLMKMFGVQVGLAFVLNAFFALLLLYFVDRWLIRWNLGAMLRACTLLAIVLLAPLAPLTTVGLEHILHALTAVGLLVYSAEQWRTPTRKGFLLLLLWAILATSARYEAAFEVACVCVLLLFSRRIVEALSTAAAGFLPILCFGLFSLNHVGTHFLPNSLLIKTRGGLHEKFGYLRYNVTYFDRQLLTIAFLLIVVLTVRSIKQHHCLSRLGFAGTLVVGTTICQLLFARVGQLGRYEAFLVILFLITLALFTAELVSSLQTPPRLDTALLLLAFLAILPRALLLHRYEGEYIQSIYLQQFQMARFFSTEYPESSVAVNDIGAVDFYDHAPNFDIFGLASTPVLNAKLSGTYDTQHMDRLTQDSNVRFVAIYTSWFPDRPPAWAFASSLTSRCGDRHHSVAGRTVAFYATRSADLPDLKAKLAAFASSLPPGDSITQTTETAFCTK